MLKLNKINKYYNRNKTNQIHVLNEINLEFASDGFIAILGASGSGKTTLLNALCGLDKVDQGTIQIENKVINKYRHRLWDDLRNQYFGYIFQNYQIFGDQTVYQNVALSLELLGIKDKELIKTRVIQALTIVKMEKYKNRLAKNLSGGEQQRVAIARSLVKDPKYVIADEPTGNLDQKNTLIIMSILKEIAKTRLVIMVTHEKPLAYMFANRIITIADGRIITDEANLKSDNISYIDQRMIYLDDLAYKNRIVKEGVDLSFYSDEPLTDESLSLNLKLIIRGNNIYLVPNGAEKKIEIVSSNSLIEVHEGSRPELDLQVSTSMEDWTSLEASSKKRYNLSLWKYFIEGFAKIMSISAIKKFMFVGFLVASFLLTLSIGLYQEAVSIDETDFMTEHRDIVSIKTNTRNEDTAYEAFLNFLELPGVYGYANPERIAQILSMEPYYQTATFSEGEIRIYYSLVHDDAFSVQPAENEVFISRGLADILLDNDKTSSYGIGFSSEKMLFNQKLSIDSKEFKIAGIEETSALGIYLSQRDFQMINLGVNMAGINIYHCDDVVTNVVNLASNEILISENMKAQYPLNVEIPISNMNFIVKGYFDPIDNDKVGYAISEQGFLKLTFKRMFAGGGYYLYSRNPNETAQAINEEGGIADSIYDVLYHEYRNSQLETLRVMLVFVVLMLIAPLIMLFLVMRSNMIARIKEIGIYRALGLRRWNIYKMHLGEILSITCIFSLSGYILALFVMFQANSSFPLNVFSIDFKVILGSAIIILLINIIVGLLPIFRLMKRTPQAILNKYDI